VVIRTDITLKTVWNVFTVVSNETILVTYAQYLILRQSSHEPSTPTQGLNWTLIWHLIKLFKYNSNYIVFMGLEVYAVSKQDLKVPKLACGPRVAYHCRVREEVYPWVAVSRIHDWFETWKSKAVHKSTEGRRCNNETSAVLCVCLSLHYRGTINGLWSRHFKNRGEAN
jgi:hypothetical protein